MRAPRRCRWARGLPSRRRLPPTRTEAPRAESACLPLGGPQLLTTSALRGRAAAGKKSSQTKAARGPKQLVQPRPVWAALGQPEGGAGLRRPGRTLKTPADHQPGQSGDRPPPGARPLPDRHQGSQCRAPATRWVHGKPGPSPRGATRREEVKGGCRSVASAPAECSEGHTPRPPLRSLDPPGCPEAQIRSRGKGTGVAVTGWTTHAN